MKKRILKIFLLCTLAIGCISIPAIVDANTSSCRKTENISKYVFQEGGIPPQTCTEGNADTSKSARRKFRSKNAASKNRNLRNVADLLMATWDSFKSECDLSKYHISDEELDHLVSYILNRNPGYFYLESGYWCYFEDGYVSSVRFNYKYGKTTAQTMLSDYNAAIGEILKDVNPSWSDLEKALYFNDYLASNCEYDTTYSKYSAYDALVDNKAVCQGYSLAYVELLSRVGIPCKVVSSDSLDHAWNVVYINNHYYYVDVTWNDPLGNYGGRAGHKFFLKSEAFFRSGEGGHLVDDDWYIDDEWDVRDANDNSYDDYFWNTMDTAFQYINGFWYAFDGKETIKKYSCQNGNFDDIENIVIINDIWYVSDNSGAFWMEKFVGTGAWDNAFYYSSPDKIYLLNIESHKSSPIYELPAEQKSSGNIYSMYIDTDGKLYYYWSGGSSPAEKKLAFQLEKETSDQPEPITCYQLRFNGNGANSGDMESINNCLYGQVYSLGKNAFIYENYEFLGWNTKPDGTGISFGNNEDFQNLTEQNYGIVTLYAQWQLKKKLPATKPKTEPKKKHTKLSNTNLKLKKGKSKKLKLLNNTRKVSWKILSGKKYISLRNKTNKSVTVRGAKKGKAKVQALVGNKKYICKVKIL